MGISLSVAFAALFPIVDPIGNVPTFLALTTHSDRKAVARKAVAAAMLVLVVFLAVGHFILEYFGISLAAVEFVGGLILGYTGWQMLSQPLKPAGGQQPSSAVYFTPLAFPLLAGPGALAVVLGFSNRVDSWLDFPGWLAGTALVLAVTYLVFVHADRVLTVVGPNGIDVLNRIMGLIVLFIAAELAFHGIADEFGLTRAG
ncbi:MarC family protein [Streptomyces sp. NPDC086023]|uniref:MarC family protein n=1 Tax=Streptomyces sp. NPDC086023 TaxID=3365746 RepID=UPI0037CF910D